MKSNYKGKFICNAVFTDRERAEAYCLERDTADTEFCWAVYEALESQGWETWRIVYRPQAA